MTAKEKQLVKYKRENMSIKYGIWSECWRDPARNIISIICSSCKNASIAPLFKINLAVDDVPKVMCIRLPYCPKCGAKMCGGAKQ